MRCHKRMDQDDSQTEGWEHWERAAWEVYAPVRESVPPQLC